VAVGWFDILSQQSIRVARSSEFRSLRQTLKQETGPNSLRQLI